MRDKDLPVRVRAGDADDGDARRCRHPLAQLSWDLLDTMANAPTSSSATASSMVVLLFLLGAARLVGAELVDALQGQADVAHDRDARRDELLDRGANAQPPSSLTAS